MQCSVCHAEVGPGNAFCQQCGAPISAAPGAAEGVGAPPPAYSAVPPAYSNVPPAYAAGAPATSSGLSDNAAAAIAYITFIPAVIFLVLEPYNRIPLVKFHSWQSIGLSVVAFALHAVITILAAVLHVIPGIFLLFTLLHLVVSLGIFVAWLIAILKASKGEWYKLPFIGDFAEKQARNGGI
jgi:uncharacterized membrane protein